MQKKKKQVILSSVGGRSGSDRAPRALVPAHDLRKEVTRRRKAKQKAVTIAAKWFIHRRPSPRRPTVNPLRSRLQGFLLGQGNPAVPSSPSRNSDTFTRAHIPLVTHEASRWIPL
ncbi:hypothetical protein E2C01_068666 [Portunus trituberculatus]|uniref:Uncharacterized protein n=1 Tax=Portunus trituberculatus TaxID=210409 RepID=A0A5B7HX13_PORTR|nr:hypothetical protein [Portunus trituberculatus]